MAMNAFETQTEQGFSSDGDDDDDVINIDSLFETQLLFFEHGKLPEDIKLPEGFEVCQYPESPSGSLVLTDGTMFIVGKLRIVCRKEDAHDPVTIGILPLDDLRFSDLIKKQLDKKAKRDAWIHLTYGARLGLDDALIDEKTFVWPGSAYWWSDESSGVTWLGLHGLNSICVVTKAGDLDVTRVHRCFKNVTVENFRKTVISEIEDLASPSSSFIKMFGQSIPKPFGVVSLALGSDDAHKESGLASGTNYGTAAATSYLERKMKMMDLEDFTVEETIKTAISAFQYLFKKELESHEIGVSVMVMDPGYVIIDEEKFDVQGLHAKHLEMTDIQNYLAAIKQE